MLKSYFVPKEIKIQRAALFTLSQRLTPLIPRPSTAQMLVLIQIRPPLFIETQTLLLQRNFW